MKGLYAITESNSENLVEKVRLALQAGVKILQYRNKTANPVQQKEEAMVLAMLCKPYGACFIVNDDVHLAQVVGAEGVHLGKEDASFKAAREILGQKTVIGVSCYQDIALAQVAEKRGASYVAFGSFYSSPTKPNAPKASLNVLREAKQKLSLPICCIGGITLKNAPPLIDAGADMVAVISSLFSAQDIQYTTQRFIHQFKP